MSLGFDNKTIEPLHIFGEGLSCIDLIGESDVLFSSKMVILCLIVPVMWYGNGYWTCYHLLYGKDESLDLAVRLHSFLYGNGCPLLG